MLRDDLGLQADVVLPGFTDNPYAWMSRASVFVLSSRFEGLPNALIEALACRVQIKTLEPTRGRIEIHYNSLDELDRVLSVLGVEASS